MPGSRPTREQPPYLTAALTGQVEFICPAFRDHRRLAECSRRHCNPRAVSRAALDLALFVRRRLRVIFLARARGQARRRDLYFQVMVFIGTLGCLRLE